MSQLKQDQSIKDSSLDIKEPVFTTFLFDFFGRIITSSIGALIGVSMFFAPFIPYIKEYLGIAN